MSSKEEEEEKSQQQSKNKIEILFQQLQQLLISVRFQKYFKLSFLIIFCIIELIVLSIQLLQIQHFSQIQNDVIVFLTIVITSIIMIPLISCNIINQNLEQVLFCCLLGCLFESFLFDSQKILRLCAFFIFSQRTIHDVLRLNVNKVSIFILVLYPAIRFSIENKSNAYLIIQHLILLLINSLFSVVKLLKNNIMQQKNSAVTQQNSQKNKNLFLNEQADQKYLIQNGQYMQGILSDHLQLLNQSKNDQSSINQINNHINNNNITILKEEDPHLNIFHTSQIKQTQNIENSNFSRRETINHKNNYSNLSIQNIQIKQDNNNQKQVSNDFSMDWIFNHLSTGIILLDLNKKLIYSNKPLKKIMNKNKSQGNMTEITQFLSLKLKTIKKLKKQYHETLEKNINQKLSQSPNKSIHLQNFQTNIKFDQFFKELKQKREYENKYKMKCTQKKQDQYGSVSYNQYQTSKNIQQKNRQNFQSKKQSDYRRTTTVDILLSDPPVNDISFLNNNLPNQNQKINLKTSQEPQIFKQTNNLTKQPKNKQFVNNQDKNSTQIFMNSPIKQSQFQYSEAIQCKIPQNINKLFTQDNLKLDDIIDFLLKFSFSSSHQYQKMSTAVELSSGQSETYNTQEEGSIGIGGKTDYDMIKMKKKTRKNLYDYSIINNQLHVIIQQEENDVLEEGNITVFEIKLCVLQQTTFEKNKFIIIETSDITKLTKQINNQIADINKSKLLSFLSNEFLEMRTPLNASIQLLELLSQSIMATDEIKKMFISPALNSNLLLLNTIISILDLAQINQGKFKMFFSEFNIDQIIECICVFNLEARMKNIQIEILLDVQMPCIIHSDLIRIRQVLMILLSNSLKFEQVSKIIFRMYSTEFNLIQIDIEDNGSGISEKKLKTLYQTIKQIDIFNFDYFQQNSLLNTIDTGMRYPLANYLASGLGGNRKLRISSVENQGTTVSFWIVNHTAQKSEIKQKQYLYNDINFIHYHYYLRE